MAKYKLLTQDGYAKFNFEVGEIYPETAESTMGVTVRNMVNTYPADWQLVEEKQEKRPIMTYVILSAMMLLYLYAGLAEINWPLFPYLGFYFFLFLLIFQVYLYVF